MKPVKEKKNLIYFSRVEVYKKYPSSGKNGKTNIKFFQNKKGVYKIYEDSKLVYVGNSRSNLYRTVLRHFQGWNDSNQLDRISYKDRLLKKKYKVEFIVTKTRDEAIFLESALIEKFKPRDNKQLNYHWFNNKFEHRSDDIKKCIDCYEHEKKDKQKIEQWEKMKFNDKGELLDDNGNVLF